MTKAMQLSEFEIQAKNYIKPKVGDLVVYCSNYLSTHKSIDYLVFVLAEDKEHPQVKDRYRVMFLCRDGEKCMSPQFGPFGFYDTNADRYFLVQSI